MSPVPQFSFTVRTRVDGTHVARCTAAAPHYHNAVVITSPTRGELMAWVFAWFAAEVVAAEIAALAARVAELN